MKNWIFVGDLHTYAWNIFPANDGYINLVYDLIANKVRELDEKLQKTSPGKTTVVLLGDMAEEPYRRGKISIAVQNALLTAITSLKHSTECDIAIIAGNHDLAAGGATWLNAFGRDGTGCADFITSFEPVILPATHTIDNAPVVLVPYAEPTRVEEMLREVAKSVPGKATICGHFAFSGTKYESGCYDDTTGIRTGKLRKQAKTWTYVLGHNHTPGQYDTGDGGIICYAGLPIPYNFGYQHDGRLLSYSSVGGYVSTDLAVPRFFGPVTPLGLDALSLRVGDFVRVYIDAHDKHTIEMLAQRYVGVNVHPCYEEPQVIDAAGQARVSDAAQLTDAGSTGLNAALSSYIKFQQQVGGCTFTEEELMAEFDRVTEGK